MAINYKRKYSKAFKYGAGAALKLGMSYKRGPSYTRTMRKKPSSGTGITQHRDSTVQYRKKRMPYRKKRTWVKFVKKVQSANERQLGTKTVVFNNANSSSTALGAQSFLLCNLYGVGGTVTAEAGSRDLLDIFQQAYSATAFNQKLTFKSAILDVTITNIGTSKVELDLYHLTYWGKPSQTSFTGCHNEAIADTPVMDPNGTGFFSAISLLKRGVTPFDMSALMKIAKFTIQKKIKYWIDVGDTITYQIRDPRTHVLSESDTTDGTLVAARQRLTQSLLAVFKPVKSNAEDVGAINMAVTRKYSLNSVDTTDQAAYV